MCPRDTGYPEGIFQSITSYFLLMMSHDSADPVLLDSLLSQSLLYSQ